MLPEYETGTKGDQMTGNKTETSNRLRDRWLNTMIPKQKVQPQYCITMKEQK